MIKKLNNLFFEVEPGESIGDGVLLYIAIIVGIIASVIALSTYFGG